MRELIYNRQKALEYAQDWALRRNPAYLNFDNIGGDCTNFASQCIYAGSGVMNSTRVTGWYYYSSSDRTASWTGVQYLYNFLVNNQSVGPYAEVVSRAQSVPGDIVQLGRYDGTFYHSPVIVAKDGRDVFVAAHTFDAYMRPLDTYVYDQARFLHIAGVRDW